MHSPIIKIEKQSLKKRQTGFLTQIIRKTFCDSAVRASLYRVITKETFNVLQKPKYY
jgi:hypothetical protein